MKYLSEQIDVAANASLVGDAIDASQLYRVSVQAVVGAGTKVDGSLQLQVSNEVIGTSYAMLPAPSQFSNLGSPVAISAALTNYLIPSQDIGYRSLRLVFTNENILVNTITSVADASSSLNSTYFLLDTSGDDYYVWFDVDGAGVDPAVADRTGIEVAISEDDSADAVASAARAAITSGASEVTVSGATDQIITTDDAAGDVSPAVDGAAPTGFSFADNAPDAPVTIYLMALAI